MPIFTAFCFSDIAKIEVLLSKCSLRNPTIYNLLLKMGLVTDLGSGVMRIIRLVKERVRKDVELEETETEFILTIPRRQMDDSH